MSQSVLLPIDLSTEASWARALPAALHLGGPDMVLHVLTVIPDFGMSVVGGFFDAEFEKRALHEVGEKLTLWVNTNIPPEIEVHPHVTHGRVYDEILRASERLDVSDIVMAAQTPDVADYLLGPNTARVVRHAKRSVYVVRGS
ncbi:Nucleotide-binding universal stress protein, UspA family [Roseivivax halotolerans]|jgi:nucleotide-binding universal stress UspA family protein|uniref:Nucleotide-binding universal stress protein, UspA family n=1 Tax=Roseivivax halotolerans TaxID=93684 RepID=A0A1I5Y8W6_9RHOB|nr:MULTISPECIES: universal stress protein [Roseivivax]QFT63885.1 Universal stress protein F [Roseivivax sp. THAF30]SFQ40639.1 Nucleotide-binding universal stress protein, UspA family [Roseivivax halotolerans]